MTRQRNLSLAIPAVSGPAPAALSLDDIRRNLVSFVKRWSGTSSEQAEKQSFWNEFFGAFGIDRKAVASFEHPVQSIRKTHASIDLFWKGRLLVEHKSAGKSLDRAASQAFTYVQELQAEISAGFRDKADLPRYIIISDFARFALYDLEAQPPADPFIPQQFALADLPDKTGSFPFLTRFVREQESEQTELSLKATALLAGLRDSLKGGIQGRELERFLVRVLFCLFADDTGIFEDHAFDRLLKDTAADGSTLGERLQRIFHVLNTPTDRRKPISNPLLRDLPYVNGELFGEDLDFAEFDSHMRLALLECSAFDWSGISPGIFGSLFQEVMTPEDRRSLGAHYTRETDILKLLEPVLIQPLRDELASAAGHPERLKALLQRMSRLQILDPACGCGNFLVVAYREMRRFEIEAIRALRQCGLNQQQLSEIIGEYSRLDVSQFGGIELQEWPARIAETALWLTDHLMNRELGDELGQRIVRLPLDRSPAIRVGNALRMDWTQALRAGTCTHVIGNPPFIGSKVRTPEQKADMDNLFGPAAIRTRRGPNADPIHSLIGSLDYVAAWWIKLADYMEHHDKHDRQAGVPPIRAAFVSTNSICQGEQVGILWPYLFRRGLRIQFAHTTFQWESEARGAAHVHVVIVGVGTNQPDQKFLVEYDRNGQGHRTEVTGPTISPYLFDGPEYTVTNRQHPLCDVPEIGIGNKPIDDGNYLFTPEEKRAFIAEEPGAAPYFRRWYGAEEFLNGIERWCLWLGDAQPKELAKLPVCRHRIEAVRHFRESSKSEGTRRIAATPTRFHVENMPKGQFLVLPKVSSERRNYMPIAYKDGKTDMGSDLIFLLPDATQFYFGILTSQMHMAWLRRVGGRLKSDYRYSAKLVYNNFPWPGGVDGSGVTSAQRAKVEEAAQAVLDARAPFEAQGTTLAQLYDPDLMPPNLAKAHQALDRIVDRLYRKEPFPHDAARVAHLMDLHLQYTTGGLELGA